MAKYYPLKMKPIFKEYIWGGNALKEKFGKDTPSACTSESWEVAAHKNGASIVANGDLAGKTLTEIISLWKAELVGEKVYAAYGERFPLLVKFLDCCDKLSVQVHPDDQYAAENENGELGKTEMWYVLDAKPGSSLVYGFKRDVTAEEFKQAAVSGKLEDLLNYVPAQKGDAFFIQAGRVHALGAGLLIAEIQQNSDTTYRVYDYNRKDAGGNGRELHVDKAVNVSDLSCAVGAEKVTVQAETVDGNQIEQLADCPYFTTQRLKIENSYQGATSKDSFVLLIFCEGNGVIRWQDGSIEAKAGDSFVLPAGLGAYSVEGGCVAIRSFVG